MDLGTVSKKHLQQLELLAGELLGVMRQAKLQDESLTEALRRLQIEAGDARRERFDSEAREYDGY